MTQTKALLLAVLQLVSVASFAVEAHAPQQTAPSHGSAPQDIRPGGGMDDTDKESASPPLITTTILLFYYRWWVLLLKKCTFGSPMLC